MSDQVCNECGHSGQLVNGKCVVGLSASDVCGHKCEFPVEPLPPELIVNAREFYEIHAHPERARGSQISPEGKDRK